MMEQRGFWNRTSFGKLALHDVKTLTRPWYRRLGWYACSRALALQELRPYQHVTPIYVSEWFLRRVEGQLSVHS